MSNPAKISKLYLKDEWLDNIPHVTMRERLTLCFHGKLLFITLIITYMSMLLRKSTIERGNYPLQAYLSFVQHKSLEIACCMEIILFSLFEIGILFTYPELIYLMSFEMNLQQTYTRQSYMLDECRVHPFTIIPSLHQKHGHG